MIKTHERPKWMDWWPIWLARVITVMCYCQNLFFSFLFLDLNLQTDPLVTLFIYKMFDQTNDVLCSIEMYPLLTPQSIIPPIVQLGQTFTFIVLSNG